ncbi:MAG: signal peptidase I [Bacteroidia bacterium]|nr:signal peptidase I [Bacteroidia bacterium]
MSNSTNSSTEKGFKNTFDFYFRHPKDFSRKQWIITISWCFLNLVIAALYFSAGASIGLAIMNFVYGCALILLYFTGMLALAISPVIYGILFVLSLVRLVDKPDNAMTYDWSDAIWFATLAATVIRSYFIEAYTIPTPSMEKSLLVGDFLFVSKFHYGTRLPLTPLSFPFAHNTLPLTDSTKSYLDWMSMPFKRLPALTQIKNNDVVVFNYPAEKGRPVDKKDNYIKRCMAIPGDSIQVIEGQVFVNGNPAPNPEKMQFMYYVKLDPNSWDEDRFQKFRRKYDISEGQQFHGSLDFGFPLTWKSKAGVENESGVIGVDSLFAGYDEYREDVFPQDTVAKWNIDYFGPLYCPKAGDVITLNAKNYALYQEAIRVYEGHEFSRQDGKYLLDGKEITSYTFKYNYYFMMGDNRHNSLDSRYWGFVPETHIVGKALFIWMSWDKEGESIFSKIRWKRIFNLIH